MSSARLHLAAAVLTALAGCGGSTPQPPPQAAAQQTSPAPMPVPVPSTPPPASPQVTAADSSWPADLLPLPQVPFPPARPQPIVDEVFRFAAEHPEVLSKMPCFCGCENRGHKHNDDCFVAARDKRGRVTAWEPHGIG
jgi:hypothetical protein